MKKSLFAILAVAACFASCSKVVESTEFDNPISFDSYVGKDAMTKASIVELEDIENVLVNAYLFETKEAKDRPFTANFMSSQPVNAKTGVYSPEKYWPATDQAIDFVAWVPEASDKKTKNIKVEDATLTFTVPSEVTEQTDLIVSEPVPAMNGALKKGEEKKVALHFKHLLSRIAFEINANGLPEESTINEVKLDYVKLIGKFASAGTVNMMVSPIAVTADASGEGDSRTLTAPTTEYVLTGPNFGWKDSIMQNNSTNDPAGPTHTTDDSYIMLIPDLNAPTGIEIKYTVTTYNDKKEVVGKPIENIAPFEWTTPFQKGKAYKFIFNVTMDKIEFTVTETPWTDATNEEQIEDLNPEEDEE